MYTNSLTSCPGPVAAHRLPGCGSQCSTPVSSSCFRKASLTWKEEEMGECEMGKYENGSG